MLKRVNLINAIVAAITITIVIVAAIGSIIIVIKVAIIMRSF